MYYLKGEGYTKWDFLSTILCLSGVAMIFKPSFVFNFIGIEPLVE